MGVWIETSESRKISSFAWVTPCVGVWIETSLLLANCYSRQVTPCVGVWIETQWEKHLAYAYSHTLRGCVD